MLKIPVTLERLTEFIFYTEPSPGIFPHDIVKRAQELRGSAFNAIFPGDDQAVILVVPGISFCRANFGAGLFLALEAGFFVPQKNMGMPFIGDIFYQEEFVFYAHPLVHPSTPL